VAVFLFKLGEVYERTILRKDLEDSAILEKGRDERTAFDLDYEN